jgi:hypothetical protein
MTGTGTIQNDEGSSYLFIYFLLRHRGWAASNSIIKIAIKHKEPEVKSVL